MTHIVPGNVAPGYSLKALDGKEYSLSSSMARGPVVLAFFKISCPVCQFTFPFLERLYKRYAATDVTILGISQDDTAATMKFNAQHGVTFPVLLDVPDFHVSNAYGLTNVPTIFLIDPAGKVQVSAIGFDKLALEAIAKALAERTRQAPAPLFLPTEKIPAHTPG